MLLIRALMAFQPSFFRPMHSFRTTVRSWRLFRLLFLVVMLMMASLAQSQTLWIGDSHSVGCFGDALREQIGKVSEISFYASCGSTTGTWIQSQGPRTTCGAKACKTRSSCVSSPSAPISSLGQLIQAHSPDRVIVALGTNMIKDKWGKTQADVLQVVSRIQRRNAQCIWLGPPQARDQFVPLAQQRLYEKKLRDLVEAEGCSYLSSFEVTDGHQIRDPVGLHYSCEQGRAWSQKLAPALTLLLSKGRERPQKTEAPSVSRGSP
jgi:hypothetical protein